VELQGNQREGSQVRHQAVLRAQRIQAAHQNPAGNLEELALQHLQQEQSSQPAVLVLLVD